MINDFGFIMGDSVQGIIFAFLYGVAFGLIWGLIRYLLFGILERKSA
jgi:hypothetical protein